MQVISPDIQDTPGTRVQRSRVQRVLRGRSGTRAILDLLVLSDQLVPQALRAPQEPLETLDLPELPDLPVRALQVHRGRLGLKELRVLADLQESPQQDRPVLAATRAEPEPGAAV